MRRAATFLVYVATAAAVLGFGRVHADFIGHYDFTGTSRFGWSLAYIGLLCVGAYAAGIPDLPRDLRGAVATAVTSAAAAAAVMSVVQLAVGSLLLPRYVVFWSAVALVPAYAGLSLVALGGRGRDEGRDRVLAVVRAEEALNLRRDLAANPERPAALVAVLEPQEAAAIGANEKGVVSAAETSRASVLVLDRTAQSSEAVVAQAATLHRRGVRVRTLSLFYEEWLGKLPVSELERVALLFDIGEVHRSRYGRVKRVADLVVGLGALPMVLVVLPFVLVGNAFANRGPLLHRQERVGRAGQPFVIFKLRTMTPGSDASRWADDDDPRVTTFGRWLRRTHVDELPQLFNVVRGHLSLVGPRPEQPRYVEELEGKLPFYQLRHLVRPGITGWAQVKFGYAGSESDALEKLQYEMYYLRHQGLALDARIVARTVRRVAAHEGR